MESSIWKYWINAWATSFRFHELHMLPCLLGCSCASDCFSQYIRCSRFWRAVNHACQFRNNVRQELGHAHTNLYLDFREAEIDSDRFRILEHLCLIPSALTIAHARRLAVAFQTYHAPKERTSFCSFEIHMGAKNS